METMINGITFKNVTAEEALVLLGFNQKRSTTSPAVVNEAPVKRTYTKRAKVAGHSMVWWTEKEINYILSNPTMKTRELQQTLNRHTAPAVSTMTSSIRNRRTANAGKYVQKIINAFYNSDKSKVDSFAESFKIPVKVQSE